MNLIAKHGVEIYADNDSFITFLNSPFLSHREFKAVDIFPSSRKLCYVNSPIHGKVVDHRVHRMRKNGMDEHVLIIDSDGFYVKILHVNPSVNVGDTVDPGETLGELYISPYFRPWTDPHIHVEIRNKNDYLRARGGLVLEIQEDKITGEFYVTDEIILKEWYILRKVKPLRYGNFYGAGDLGIIDGGFPHYLYGFLLGSKKAYFLGKEIGKVLDNNIIEFFNITPEWKGIVFRAIGFYIYLNENVYLKYIFRSREDYIKAKDIFQL